MTFDDLVSMSYTYLISEFGCEFIISACNFPILPVPSRANLIILYFYTLNHFALLLDDFLAVKTNLIPFNPSSMFGNVNSDLFVIFL